MTTKENNAAALTWQDVRDILAIEDALLSVDGDDDEPEFPPSWRLYTQSFCEEVLQGYNAMREKQP